MAWIIKFPGKVTAELTGLGWKVKGSPSMRRLLDTNYDPRKVGTDIPDRLEHVAELAARELGGRITKRDPRKRREETYYEPIY